MYPLVLLACFVCYLLYHELWGKRKHLPPGPTPLPWIGNGLQMDLKAPHRTLDQWAKTYGPVFTVWLGPQANVVITDYGLIKQYLTGRTADSFAGRPANYVFEQFTGGNYGLAISHGPQWKEQRRFSLTTLRNFGFGRNIMEQKILTQTDELVEHITDMMEGATQKVLDISEPLQLCVGNIISAVVLGHTFHRNNAQFNALKKMLEENFKLVTSTKVNLLGAYPWLRFIPFFDHFGYDTIIRHRDMFNSFLFSEVNEHKMNFDPKQEPEDYTAAYLKQLHELKSEGADEKNSTFSEFQLAMTIGDLWIAGMETTVTTLRWAILYLIMYPEVQAKIRSELEKYYGRSSSGPVAMADRLGLPYTCATLHEIQRVANIVPVNLQHSLTEDLAIEKFHLKKGTVIIPQIASVHMDGKIFGDPEKFDPDRFITDGKFQKAEEVIPFSLGKRQCLGESLARMELFLIFTTLMKVFSFDMVPDRPQPSLESAGGINRTPEYYKVLVTKLD